MTNVKTTLKTCAALMVAGTLFFTACKKSNSATQDVGYGQDQAQLDKTSDDVQTMSDEAYQAGSGGKLTSYRTAATTIGPCATITKDTTANGGTITIDFGPTDCLCQDGNYRKGKVIVNYTSTYMTQGSVHTISFSNYFVNDNQVTGTKTVTNEGANLQGQTNWNIAVNDSIILANGAGTISWTATRTRTLTGTTPTQYSITGGGTLTRANGAVVTHTITTPLVITAGCPWIEQGTVSCLLANGKTAIVDYGTGTCDATATVTYNGNVYNVTQRR